MLTEKVQLLTYTDALDAYGQKRQSTPSSVDIEVNWHYYSQNNINNPFYNDVEVIALTKAAVTTKNEIMIGTDKYSVKKVIPSSRWTQVFLKREK